MDSKTINGMTAEEMAQDFLSRNAPPPDIGPGEITPQMAAEAWGKSESTARRRLLAMVEDGLCEAVQRTFPNGVVSDAFIPLPNED